MFFLTAKIDPILVPCKFFPHFLHQIWRHLPLIATSIGSTLYSCRVESIFAAFFYKVLYFKTKWSVYERRRSIYLRMLCVCERRCSVCRRIMCIDKR